MLPITIICHADCIPAGYLCRYFDKQHIAYKKINIQDADISRLDLDSLSGLIFMGGPHSANDEHDWLRDEIDFIKKAIAKDIPIMGVCLGAQIVSKALGAEVSRAEHMETGWHKITADTSKLINYPPLNLPQSFDVFEWHEDSFTIPTDAMALFKGTAIENQGYVYGKVLVMQFHLEMTEHMVYQWLDRYNDCLPEPSHSVQCPEQITQHLAERLDNLHVIADILYGWWLSLFEENPAG